MTPSARLEVILGLLTLVLVLEIVSRRVRLPPSAVLVLGGIVLALVPGGPHIVLDPDLILLLFLPPLLFSSAYLTIWRDFRANLRIILQLAVGAVAFTTLVVGVATHLVMPSLPWAACFALGAIVSPPDAVAAKAVLKGIPLPARLVTLLEGESLINDATGLVLFRIAIAAGMTGAFSAWGALGSFAMLSAGGVVTGVVLGYGLSFALARVREPLLSIMASLLGAWGAYMAGDLLHVSGVLSTVCCGLVLGWRQHDLLPASVRTQANAVWSVLVFMLESLIFIMIGMSLRGVLERLSVTGVSAWSMAGPVAAVAAAMLLARFFWIVPTAYLPRFIFPSLRRRDPYPPFAVPIVMSWAGMRGVVSLAAALSVPERFAGRDFILAATFSVILISILLQGATLAPMIRLLRLCGFELEGTARLVDGAAARVLLARAALAAIERRSRLPDGQERHPRLVEQYAYRAKMAERFVAAHGKLDAARHEHYSAILEANRASRAELLRLHRTARIHDSVLQLLEVELDLEELGARQSIAGETDEES
jgi:Na+/H+ antiporter